MDNKKKVMKCNECWREFEIEDNEDWGYCPFCENDQVEISNCNLDEYWEEQLWKKKRDMKLCRQV